MGTPPIHTNSVSSCMWGVNVSGGTGGDTGTGAGAGAGDTCSELSEDDVTQLDSAECFASPGGGLVEISDALSDDDVAQVLRLGACVARVGLADAREDHAPDDPPAEVRAAARVRAAAAMVSESEVEEVWEQNFGRDPGRTHTDERKFDKESIDGELLEGEAPAGEGNRVIFMNSFVRHITPRIYWKVALPHASTPPWTARSHTTQRNAAHHSPLSSHPSQPSPRSPSTSPSFTGLHFLSCERLRIELSGNRQEWRPGCPRRPNLASGVSSCCSTTQEAAPTKPTQTWRGTRTLNLPACVTTTDHFTFTNHRLRSTTGTAQRRWLCLHDGTAAGSNRGRLRGR